MVFPYLWFFETGRSENRRENIFFLMNPNDPNVDTYDSTIIYGDVNLTWQAFPLEGKRRPLMTPVSPSVLVRGQTGQFLGLRQTTKFFLWEKSINHHSWEHLMKIFLMQWTRKLQVTAFSYLVFWQLFQGQIIWLQSGLESKPKVQQRRRPGHHEHEGWIVQTVAVGPCHVETSSGPGIAWRSSPPHAALGKCHGWFFFQKARINW